MLKDQKIEFRCTETVKTVIEDNARCNHMSVGEYVEACCIPKRIPSKRKQQMATWSCVKLIQLCNDSPELKQEIGGIVCQLKECL